MSVQHKKLKHVSFHQPVRSTTTVDAVSLPASQLVKQRQGGGYQCCPLLTRSRLVMMFSILLMSTVLLLLQCIHPGLLHSQFMCCNHEFGAFQQAVVLNKQKMYQDYDETLEGDGRIRYKHTKRRLPQCIIIGARKSGTRALLEFLNMHPQVQAEKREMHFFDDDITYSKGLDWYRKRMPWSYGDQVTIEKTPSYFIVEEVPERVFHMNKSIKLLLVVRDPIQRTISDYMQIHSSKLKKGRLHASFEDLVTERENGDIDKSYKAIRRSIYHRHMEHWLNYFPLQQFHIVSGENLVKNPVDELRKVETFLGIDHRLKQENFFYNDTRGFYCMQLHGKEKCLAPSKGRQHPSVQPPVLDKLKEFFKPHNERFYDMVGINFGWQ